MEDRRIYLVQSQLDNTYQHTPNFRNRDEQFNWFLKSKHLPLNVNVKSDSFREKVVIKENIDNLLEYDYLIINENLEESAKTLICIARSAFYKAGLYNKEVFLKAWNLS